jgi:hypothetical protein
LYGTCTNGREVLDDVIGRSRQQGVDDEGADTGKQDGMAIGPRLGDDIRTDHRVGARPIVHDHLLAQAFGQALPDESCHRVVAATGSVRADASNRSAGIGLLGDGRAGDNQCCGCEQYSLYRHEQPLV